MTDQTNGQSEEETLDGLFGGLAIARFLNRPRQFVYNKQKELGIGRVGSTLATTKSHLRQRLSQRD